MIETEHPSGNIANNAAEETAAVAADNNGSKNQKASDQKASEAEIDALQGQLKEQQNKYLYLYAELENYKKRSIKERSDLLKFGHESFARELLQVSDNLGRALEHTNNHEALVQGIQMVNNQLSDTLKKFGITQVNALGQKFDPQQHEAVGQEKITAPGDEQLDGTIIREHQKGYTLHGRLLRPARVVVASKQ